MPSENITNTEEVCKEQKYNPGNIKEAFKDFISQPIWVVSDLSKNKIPIDPKTAKNAACNDPNTWATFEQAESFCKERPGFAPAIVITPALNLVCIDLDHVRNENNTSPWADEMIQQCATYTEISVSGGGLHLFAKGKKPGKECKKGQIEIYDSNKIITVTGQTLNGHKQIIDAQIALNTIYHDTFKINTSSSGNEQQKQSPFMSDEEVISLCRKAKNSDKFKALYDEGKHEGDASSADMSLCSILAFYTQNKEQLDRLFRKSKLMREKWNREDYKQRTITKALHDLKTTFQSKKETEEEASWEKPSKITEDVNLNIEFPINELPDVLKNAVKEVSRFSCVDPALVSLPGLGITSLVIGKKAVIVEKPGLKHHCSLFFLGVASSGERKSSCFDCILDGVKEEIENEMEEYNKSKASVRAHNELIKEAVAEIKKSLKEKKISPQIAQQQIEELYANEKQPPPEPHNFGDDLTEQRLFQKIADHGGAYGVFSSDGRGIIKKILGTKTGESGESIYLAGMWGDDLSRSRVGSNKGDVGGEDLRIRKPALTTVAFIQPDLWEDLSRDTRMRESGFISRITLVIPISQMGTRLETEDDPPLNQTKVNPFTEAILRLRKWKPKVPIEIHLSYEAAEMRREFFNSIEKELGSDQETSFTL